MVLRRWEPFREMRRLEEEMERLWREVARPWLPWRAEEWSAPIDMYATPDSVVIKAALPGIRPEDVDITITGNSVTIKGEVKAEEEVKERDYILREHRFGSFSRTVTLPEGVDTDKAEASYENGILTITLPKREEVKPKSLKVKVSPTIEGRKKR